MNKIIKSIDFSEANGILSVNVLDVQEMGLPPVYTVTPKSVTDEKELRQLAEFYSKKASEILISLEKQKSLMTVEKIWGNRTKFQHPDHDSICVFVRTGPHQFMLVEEKSLNRWDDRSYSGDTLISNTVAHFWKIL
jgi:hypothetical protein